MKTNMPELIHKLPYTFRIKIRNSLPIYLLVFFCFLQGLPAIAKTSRALIIGIDLYKPPGDNTNHSTRTVWRNLNGCVNDAGAIKDLVISRYLFPPQNIRTLFNQEASRLNILAELKHLIEISEKGDVVFIYYAGHGSQVMNSLSREKDKKDETIVPADAYKGAKDIRDKELAALFNQLLDKGVMLTVIFDSCHSGSAGRGQLYAVPGVRNLDPDPNDVADASDPEKPEERGALVMSAAQDFEFAKEIADENNIIHGAFTLALLKSLQQNAVDAPVENIFSGVQAIMKYYGKTQEPVLAGAEERKKAGLFGTIKEGRRFTTRIPVLKSEADKIELMGGYAFGLSTGQVLKSVNSNDSLLITEMVGANRSIAKRLSSASVARISPGTLFEVTNWTSSALPALKIYIPSQVMDIKQLGESITALQAYRKSNASVIIHDITRQSPERLIHYGNNVWYYQVAGEIKQDRSLKKLIAADKSTVFVNLPPEQTFSDALKTHFSGFDNIQLVSTPGEALYSLTGRLNEKNEVEYGFIRNNYYSSDSAELLPVRTDFVRYDPAGKDPATVVEKLAEDAFQIARIRNWLMLEPPAGENRFPFELDVSYYRSGVKPANGRVKLRDTLSFFINKIPSEKNWNRKKRYVYVFTMDANGAMKLVFPSPSRGNVENRFPVTDELNNTETRSRLFDILVKPPAGNDVYFMLSTEEAISNLSVFQQSGVITRGPANSGSGIEALLFTGSKSRNKITTPLTWSIQKIVLHIQSKSN